MTVLRPQAFVALGLTLNEFANVLATVESGTPLTDEEKSDFEFHLTRGAMLLSRIGADVSARLFESAISELPETYREADLLYRAAKSELENRKLYVLEKGAQKYWDDGELISDQVRLSFPNATSELIAAGKALCFELADASIFHCSRAYEQGARALAIDLGCTFAAPLEQIDLHPLLNQCEAKIEAIRNLPKSEEKADRLEFYSTAAASFRYFKDGWRIRGIHGRATFTRPEAQRLFESTLDFFEIVSKRLAEKTDH